MGGSRLEMRKVVSSIPPRTPLLIPPLDQDPSYEGSAPLRTAIEITSNKRIDAPGSSRRA